MSKNQEIVVNPRAGALNSDDAIDKLPKNDFKVAKNLTASFGNEYFRKINGTREIDAITGDCFGFFDVGDYLVMFIDNGNGTGNYPHEVYLIHKDDTVEKIFEHEFDLDTSIELIKCILVNDEILLFNNGVDEVMKLHIGMARLSVGYDGEFPQSFDNESFFKGSFNFDGQNFIIENVTEYDGSALTLSSSITSVYVARVVAKYYELYSLTDNYVFDGYVDTQNNTFVITSELPEITLTTAIQFTPTEDSYIGYRKISTDDYYLINTPPLDPPQVDYISNADRAVNRLKNNTFQFQARYVYYDNTQSAWSPISELLIDDSFGFLEYDNNNGISISVNHPNQYGRDNVKEVVFGVRINEGRLYEFNRKSTITGDYGFFITDLETPIQTTFYNDEVLLPVPEEDYISQFDRIGRTVGDIEIVNDSVVILANNKLPKANVSPDIELTPIIKDAVVDQSEDWFFAYRYLYKNWLNNYIEGENVYSSTGTQIADNTGLVADKMPYYWKVSNRTAKGEQVEPFVNSTQSLDSVVAKTVTTSKSITARGREYGFLKAYTYFDFSSTQEIGTVYDIEIKLYRRHPSTGSLQFIKSAKRDFLASTTSTHSLLENIKDWIENKSGLNGFSYGTGSDEIETRANIGVDGFESEFSGIDPRSDDSFQILSGFKCNHSPEDSGHYHWYQVDQLEVNIEKISATNYITKTFKNQAEHPFALRYRDRFGRVLTDVGIGSIDLSNKSELNKLYEADLKINHFAPKNAARYDVLYAGNKSFTNFIYAIVDLTGVTASTQNEAFIKLDFSPYNDAYGASLSYSVTDGDVIQRLASTDGTTYTELEDKKAYRVLRESGTEIVVERDSGNEFAAGDLVVIHTPKLEVDEENTLYYESGLTFEVENGAHRSDNGSQLMNESFDAAFRFPNGSSDINQTEISGFNVISFTISPIEPPDVPPSPGEKIEILNTKYKGFYNILSTDQLSTTYVVHVLIPDVIEFEFEEDYIYLTWEGATETTYTNVYQRQAFVKLQNFGDVYLRWRDANYDHLVESYSMNDTYKSDFWGKGRPVIIGENQRIDSGNLLYCSEPYFNNTNLNGISTVYGNSFQEYSSRYGDTMLIHARNGRLLLFHERKIGWVDLAKSVVSTADGEQILTQSKSVISPVENFYDYDGGIGSQVYSFCNYGENLFFANDYQREIVKIYEGQLQVISKIKMGDYFNDKLQEEGLVVKSYFDRQNYHLVLHLNSSEENILLPFSDREKKWLPLQEVPADHIRYFEGAISFKDGKVYRHDDDVNLLDIYGVGKTAEIDVVFNDLPRLYKVWKSVMMEDDFIDDLSLVVTNEKGQLSELSSASFRRVDIGHWAPFRRDMNSDVDFPIVNGAPLRSKLITVKLRSSTITDKYINNVFARFQNITQ